MDDKPKKKVVLKKASGDKKTVIRLNPAATDKPPATTSPPTVAATKDAEPSTSKLKISAEKATSQSGRQQRPAGGKNKESGPIFKFYCVYCGQKLSTSMSTAGRNIKCPTCEQRIVIPAPPAE